jgi:hypothetical protein
VRARGSTQFGWPGEATQIEDRTRGAGPGRWAGTGGTICGQMSFVFSGSGGARVVGCPAGDLAAGDGGAVGLSAGRPCLWPGVERDDPDDPRSGAAGAGSFQRDQREADLFAGPAGGSGFFRTSCFQTGRIYLFWPGTHPLENISVYIRQPISETIDGGLSPG